MLRFDTTMHRDASEGYDGPVPVLQRHWEFEQLLRLYVQRRPARVLEVGTYHGGTLYHWLRHAAPGTLVLSVDQPPAGTGDTALFHTWAPPRVELRCLRGDSTDPAMAAAASRFGPFDFVFLDAGHAEHEIRADWANYHPLCAPGSVIALHDILPGRGAQSWIQVAPVWRDIQAAGAVTQELIATREVDWGGIGVVYR